MNNAYETYGFLINNIGKGYLDYHGIYTIFPNHDTYKTFNREFPVNIQFVEICDENLTMCYYKDHVLKLLEYCNENFKNDSFVLEKYKYTRTYRYNEEIPMNMLLF